MPVSEDLDTRVRLAARAGGVTVAAWVREQLLIAVRHPRAPLPPISEADERAIRRAMHLPLMPMLLTTKEAPLWSGLSTAQLRRALRAGDLAEHHEQWSVWDKCRGKFLRRQRWRSSEDALLAYYAKRAEYEAAHQRRPYTRRPSGPPAGPTVGRGRDAGVVFRPTRPP